MTPKTRVAIYTRVSSEEQLENYSLDAQYEYTKNFAEGKGWQIVRVYEERGRSGKSTIRPEFQQMMGDAKLGLFDVVLVHKLDRFSRSLIDVLISIKELNERHIVLVSASEPMLDFSTPQGKFMAVMMAAFAEWYLDNLRDEIKKGKKERVRQGDWNGTLSYGYTTPQRLKAELQRLGEDYKARNIPEDEYERRARLYEDGLEQSSEKHQTAAIPHPVDQQAIQLAFTSYATGQYSDKGIAQLLNQHGYRISIRKGSRPFGKDTITDLLQNRFYTGVVQYKGEWTQGAHLPLISNELFDECQRVRERRARKHNITPHNAKRIYPLGGLVVCLTCGTHLFGQTMHDAIWYRDPGRDGGKRCPETVKAINALDLERIVGDWLCSLPFPADWEARLKERFEAKPATAGTAVQRQRIEKQLANLLELFKLGDIDRDTYMRERTELKTQLAALTPVQDQETTLLELQQVVATIQSLRPIWNKANLKEKKALVGRLIKRIYVKNGQVAAIEPQPVLWYLLALSEAGKTGTYPNLLAA